MILDMKQAANRLNVHYSTVYRWVDKGLLPSIRVGGEVFIKSDVLKDFKRPTKGRKKSR